MTDTQLYGELPLAGLGEELGAKAVPDLEGKVGQYETANR